MKLSLFRFCIWCHLYVCPYIPFGVCSVELEAIQKSLPELVCSLLLYTTLYIYLPHQALNLPWAYLDNSAFTAFHFGYFVISHWMFQLVIR